MNDWVSMRVWIFGLMTSAILGMAIVIVFMGYNLHQANNGDLNHDGKVNISDLATFATHYKDMEVK